MAYETQGTKFFWSASTSRSTAIEIGQVQNWSGLGGTAPVIDVTHLGSTAREKMMGLRDPGELTLGLIYSAGDTGQSALQTDAGTRTLRKMTVKWSTVSADGQECHFDAYSGGLEISGAEDDKVAASAQIIIADAVTHTTYAT